MTEQFSAVPVTEQVYWVGAVDWEIRDFHGYATNRGTTYNAYLILADKVTLIDTVKAPFKGELLSRIASVIDPKRIDYIVSDHAEMDHSGCLAEVAAAVGAEKVFASKMGVKALDAHFHSGMEVHPLAEGEQLDLGSDKLTFFETKMCHWPDSMVAYLHGDKMLFSQDAFGLHLASSERFDDEIPAWVLDREAAKYFANILMPFLAPIRKAMDKLTSSGLEFDTVAPDHGPVWRTDVAGAIGRYRRWIDNPRTSKALVVYDTMWNSTAQLARAIGDGLASRGAGVKLMPLSSCHRSDVATELLEAGALFVGSPTINGNMFPTVADVLCYLKGLSPKGLIGGTFGSYGWSGQATKQVADALGQMGVELLADPIRTQYVPVDSDIQAARQLGVQAAVKLKEMYG